ncbi:hypothetical protein [Arsenicibacter rosenii]|uniref:Uncharacterized protein n=1 Tax=Arsenicibacter rosenii TaxID=1750698 RepID=A0A1S2VC14_9BACT|nr:hypothetical protein [Arsenicibacter rosenii]OIN56232.1 hypothetical protein BLX24_25890 [Arsenicibacter rosenii]
MSKRIDLSDWLIHFVHRKNPDNVPLDYTYDEEYDLVEEEDATFPDSFDSNGKEIYKTIQYEEDYFELSPDEHAFTILKKILTNGYVKTGWSHRKSTYGQLKPTIYGPYSASCFTEMPLYGLIEYAKKRNSENNVQTYGVAFLKNEMFTYGARPVIYGLSNIHSEANNSTDPYFDKGLRCLSHSCGLGLQEQYRYVATNLAQTNKIDWTHEREWRWADTNNKYETPGLPFYLKDNATNFSRIIVFVSKDEEAEDLINFLKTLHHATCDPFGREYNLKAIENTFVLSLESINKLGLNTSNIRIDDLPFKSLPAIKQKIEVSAKILKFVKDVWEEACIKAFEESERIYKSGKYSGMSAFVNVSTYTSHSEITQALIDLGIAKGYADKYYLYGLRTIESMNSVEVEIAGAKVAAEYLTQKLNQNFHYEYRWD